MSEKCIKLEIPNNIINCFGIQPSFVDSEICNRISLFSLYRYTKWAGDDAKTNNVGFIGGIQTPVVSRFEYGYKAGVSSGVGVRPSNFYIAPGEKSLDELFAECDNGFYLTDVQGLHAGINIINGDFSLQAQGFEIVAGKLGKPVTLVVASGNITSLLNDVLEIGSDLTFKTGSIGAPSLLVGKLSISGK